MISLQNIIDHLTPMERAEAALLLLRANERDVSSPNKRAIGRPKGAKNKSILQQGQDRLDAISKGVYDGI